ncbi:HelD family protein [Acetonema longum]|uniref:Superfamily I DNA helicase n=1 Tax=Acetonema longum DSM 6540 TaxID=1009370 RepID=F7NGZ3_9FIRM|nr:UvrD-helicase domain-containing protein [Acetonema longum]EGO64724.1 superfamily I DNA helicase [Acetonema longum DSM 6540]
MVEKVETHPDFAAEQEHLAAIVREMRQIMTDLYADIDDHFQRSQKSLLVKDEISAYVHTLLRGDNARRIQDIESASPNPYFGRVDFREDGTEEPDGFESFYIGRYKVARLQIQSSKDILVFDWRDPVSTIFYECYGGRASYEVLGRYHYSGDVRLKRQYKIENSILKAIVDNYVMDQVLSRQQQALLADPLLSERLRQGAADKLRDIVTSIQAEQNKIIREPLNQVTVIQGVAGSGKSTVGLHRLSYLLYNEKLDPKKLVVIAPNRIFLDYISELLPEIDAADVRQMVWDDVAFMILGRQCKILDDHRLDLILAGIDKDRIRLLEDTAHLKGSLDFIKILETYIERKVQKFCLKLADIRLFDGKLAISSQDQMDKFMEDVQSPYNERLEILSRYIRFRVTNYVEILEARQVKGAVAEEEVKRCRQEADRFFKSHFKSWNSLDLLTAYRELFAEKTVFKPVKDKQYDLESIRSHSLTVLDAGQIERDDLAPLAYLSQLLDGWSHITKFDHIVVDEAQDLNPLEFAILKRLSANGSFTIMGDLSQGIHSYRSISSWNVILKEVFADARAVYREILYSYRSAREIIDVFNRVMPQGHSRAIPVYEIGRKPTAEKIITPQQGVNRLVHILQTFLERGAKSIGIITKLEQDAKELYERLSQAAASENLDFSLHLVSGQGATYQGGISVLPVSWAKGLEFDGVIIANASASEFTADPVDARLLYVALSRAMHQLHIMYHGKLTPLLTKK